MLISFILLLGYWRLAKQVWATKCWVLIYKAAVNTESLETPENLEYFKRSHHLEIKWYLLRDCKAVSAAKR